MSAPLAYRVRGRLYAERELSGLYGPAATKPHAEREPKHGGFVVEGFAPGVIERAERLAANSTPQSRRSARTGMKSHGFARTSRNASNARLPCPTRPRLAPRWRAKPVGRTFRCVRSSRTARGNATPRGVLRGTTRRTTMQHRTFSATVDALRYGSLADDLTAKLREVVAACATTGRAGSITLTLALKPGKGGQIEVFDDIKTKLPKEERGSSLMFATPDNNLQREDPRQLTLEGLRSVDAETGELRNVGAA